MNAQSTERVRQLQYHMQAQGFDAYLAGSVVSTGYLVGFHEGGYERMLVLVIPARGEPVLICPALTVVAASAHGIENMRSWRDGENPVPLFTALSRELNLKRVAIDDQMPAAYLVPIQAACPDLRFELGDTLLSILKCAKTPEQLDCMRHAAKIADEAQLELQRRIKPGMTEKACADIVKGSMTANGCQPTFCIVATGTGSAEPHHVPGEETIESGDVVIVDCGCLYKGYNSDTTRTFAVGRASPEAHKVYEIVYRSHMAACAAVKPGVSCESIDKAARDVIEQAGYGEYFVHRTGHGIGTQVHEPPYIVKGSKQPLVVGQCFSVEPGIYLPGKFGVRIENVVSVGEGKVDSINAAPPERLIETSV